MDRQATRIGRARRASARRRGFTLIELLTIIAILGLLISMLAPAVLKVYENFKINQTKAYIGQIDAGIQGFKADHDDTPPPSDGSYPCPSGTRKVSPATGAAGLVQCLVGYRGSNDDGVDGPGWRKVHAGKIYFPYVTPDMPMTNIDNEAPRFMDAFGNEILYYRWNGRFNGGDNSDGPKDIMGYVRNPGPDSGKRPYYRQDYVLITPGPDRKWAEGLTASTKKVDDLANFSFYTKEE